MGFFWTGLSPRIWTGDGVLGPLAVSADGALPAGINDYTTFSLGAGNTITAPISISSPLVIRAAVSIDITGTLTAKGRGWVTGTRSSGGSGYGGSSTQSGLAATLGPVQEDATTFPWGSWNTPFPIPGGSGGGGAATGGGSAGYRSLPANNTSQTSALIFPPAYRGTAITNKVVASHGGFAGIAGGLQGAYAGIDGAWGLTNALGAGGADDTAQIGNFDFSSILRPELMSFAVGCGGGGGGMNAIGAGAATGGDGGSLILLIAPTVYLRAGAVLDVRGNDGAAGTSASSGTGGGGGGGGGCIAIICRQLILTAADGVTPLAKNLDPSAAGGVIAADYNIYLQGGAGGAAGGAGNGAGGAGANGAFSVRQIL